MTKLGDFPSEEKNLGRTRFPLGYSSSVYALVSLLLRSPSSLRVIYLHRALEEAERN